MKTVRLLLSDGASFASKKMKDCNCRKKEEHESCAGRSQKYKMGTNVLESILFLSLYLPHTWCGELHF